MSTPSMQQRRAALAYINRIRNTRKQAYAELVHIHLLMPDVHAAPTTTFGLGLMARQAVERDLSEILGVED